MSLVSDDDDDDMTFHSGPIRQDATAPKAAAETSSSLSSSTSSSSTSSSPPQAIASQEPPSKKPRIQRKKQSGENRNAPKPVLSKTSEAKMTVDSTKLLSTEALKWAERLCKFAYESNGKRAYDRVDVFTEFSGSTCAESAVESVINHMNPKPELNFCYAADIKPGCRKVATSTRPVLSINKTSFYFQFKYLCICIYRHCSEKFIIPKELKHHPDPTSCCFGDILELLPDDIHKKVFELNTEEVPTRKLYTNEISLKYFSTMSYDEALHSQVSYTKKMIWLCQVVLSTKVIVAAAGKTDNPLKVLFSKGGKLKKSIGDAHKGWILISTKGSQKDSAVESLAEAQDALHAFYAEADHRVQSMSFVFGRQKLILKYMWGYRMLS